MQYVNSDNSQFIQPKVNSISQATFKKQSGGKPYGVTMDSLADSTIIGKSRPFISNHYSNCSKQSGGNKYMDATSYGFTKEGASLANEVRGSYAPISGNKSISQCGGRKRKSRRRRKSKRRRKSRKSKRRRKRRKTRTKRRKQRGGCGCAMNGGKRKKRRSRRRRKTRKQRGGRYQQYGSNVPSSAGYSMPNPGSTPWATGPGSYSRYQNCK